MVARSQFRQSPHFELIANVAYQATRLAGAYFSFVRAPERPVLRPS